MISILQTLLLIVCWIVGSYIGYWFATRPEKSTKNTDKNTEQLETWNPNYWFPQKKKGD